jgi:[acyl-carrier-protein] S-malonyltransferase
LELVIAVVFPGQGSQRPGMGRELAEGFAEADHVFEEVSESTGIDMRRVCWQSDEETLRRTENAQLALFTAGLAAYRAFTKQFELQVDATAGHSVGEYAALVAAEVFKLEDGAKLVQARGETMANAGDLRPGTMAAVLGLEADELARICAEAEGIAVIANDNCPCQLVISGEISAIADVSERAVKAGAKRVLPLNVSGAFHSPLMHEASLAMRHVFDSYPNQPATLKIYSNVTAEVETEGFVWPELLELQLRSRVRWTETVQHMIRDGIDTFVECGVGEVLSGLIRRTDKSARCLKVYDVASLEATLSALA